MVKWILARSFLVLTVVLIVVWGWQEVWVLAPDLNDGVLHIGMAKRAADAWARGEDPTDHWVPYWGLGYPVGHHYQFFPAMVNGLLIHLTDKRHALLIYRLVTWSLMLLSAYALYRAARRLHAAQFEASLVPLFWFFLGGTEANFGLEVDSYTWRGIGLHTQLWAMALLPLTLAAIWHYVQTGRHPLRSASLLTLLWIMHLMYGYIAIVSLAPMIVFPIGDFRRRLKRAGYIVALTAGTSAFYWVPFLIDRAEAIRNVWEPLWKWNSRGMPWVVQQFASGLMMDGEHLPVLTIFAVVGGVVAAWKRTKRDQLWLSMTALWAFFTAGRASWGFLIDLIPLSRSMHQHRLLAGLQLALLMLAARGMTAFCGWCCTKAVTFGRTKPGKGAAAKLNRYGVLVQNNCLSISVVIVCLVMLPPFLDRLKYFQDNKAWMKTTKAVIKAKPEFLEAVALAQTRPGRVYAGLSATWAKKLAAGSMPMHAFLGTHQLDSISYLYIAMSKGGDFQYYFDESRLDHYWLFGIKTVLAPKSWAPPRFVQPIFQQGDVWGYEVVGDDWGMFDVVDASAAIIGEWEDIHLLIKEWMSSKLVATGHHPLILRKGDPPQGLAIVRRPNDGKAWPTAEQWPSRPRGRIVTESCNDQSYASRVLLADPGYVMLKVTTHPGWQCLVDGKERKPVVVAPCYPAIYTESGEHTVEFRYRAPWYRLPLLVMGLALLICNIWILNWWQKRA